jgi:hypothetical protein
MKKSDNVRFFHKWVSDEFLAQPKTSSAEGAKMSRIHLCEENERPFTSAIIEKNLIMLA